MKTAARHAIWTLVATAGLGCLLALPLQAQSGDVEAYGDEYASGDFGRVRYQENGVTIQRAYRDDGVGEEPADVNAPIFPGDEIVTDSSQRVEIQLAAGGLVRVDRGTVLTLLALPEPSATYADNTVLQLDEGTIRVSASPRSDEEFRIDTPASSIYLVTDADVRIEVDRHGRTTVVSRRGVAEVAAAGGSVILRSGSVTEIDPDSTPLDPYPFNTYARDGFDDWVADRESSYRVRERYRTNDDVYDVLPEEVRPYYTELSYHGSWNYVNEYGYVWCPTRLASDWRPYHDGYWTYGPHGYFWVSHDPWGWAPYHYGRWVHLSHHGWSWVPGRVFAGAWVSWSWGSTYVGWSPLDYWNRPALVVSFYSGYYDPFAWTFVGYPHFGYRDCGRYAVGFDRVRNHLAGAALVTRPPRFSPGRLAASVELRQRAVSDAKRQGRPLGLGATATAGGKGVRLGDLERQLIDRRRDDRASVTRGVADNPSRFARARGENARGEKAGGVGRRLDPRDLDGKQGARPQVRPLQEESSGSTDRMRDIYRRMAQPRRTQEQSKAEEQPKPRPGAAAARPTERAADKPQPEKARGQERDSSAGRKPESPARDRGGKGREATAAGPSASSAAPYKRSSTARATTTPSSRASVPSRPTSQRASAPARPAPQPRASIPSRQASQPRASAPSRPAPQPRANIPSRQASQPRASAPSRPAPQPRANIPSRQASQPRASAPSRPAPQPRTSAPDRPAPAPRAAAPRSSAPERAAPTRTAPSRSSGKDSSDRGRGRDKR